MIQAYLLAALAWLVRRIGRVIHDLGWRIHAHAHGRENQITQLGQTLISVAHAIERRADHHHDGSWRR